MAECFAINNILIYRPLIFAVIEFSLVVLVVFRGRFAKELIAALILFLGGYQLGEFLMLKLPNVAVGHSVSFFSTTLLPAIGLMIIEKISGKKYYSKIVLLVALCLALLHVLNPDAIQVEGCRNCFLKYGESLSGPSTFTTVWKIYYLAGLTISIGIIAWNIFGEKVRTRRVMMSKLLIAYLAFFPTSYILVYVAGLQAGFVASVMCALAIFTAFIASHLSLAYSPLSSSKN